MLHNSKKMTSSSIVQEDVLPEQILEAALQLYLQYGLKKVTMNDVANRIGKSRSVLYYYYKDKNEIFDAVMDMLIREIVNEIGQKVSEVTSLKNKLRTFCLMKIKTSEARKPVFTALEAGMDSDEISLHTQIMHNNHKRMMQAESALLSKILSESIRNGEIRRLKPQEQKTLILFLLSSVRGIKREMERESDFSKLSSVIDMFSEMIIKWLSV